MQQSWLGGFVIAEGWLVSFDWFQFIHPSRNKNFNAFIHTQQTRSNVPAGKKSPVMKIFESKFEVSY